MTNQEATQEMTTRELLLKEIEQSPDMLLGEVLDFLLFIRARQTQKDKKNTESSSTAPYSTARSILDNLDKIGTWEGDDFEECLQMVYASRSKVNFSKHEPF